MANDVKSRSSDQNLQSPKLGNAAEKPQDWVKMGAIAAASAVVGGLAAAWFYRKTLSRLREAENEIPDMGDGTTEFGSEEDF